jgi:hypothetical protein
MHGVEGRCLVDVYNYCPTTSRFIGINEQMGALVLAKFQIRHRIMAIQIGIGTALVDGDVPLGD